MATVTNSTTPSPQGQNFSDADLRDRDFRNQHLSYANFARSDIRGANFTGATLSHCNFTQVRSGLTSVQQIIRFVVALFLFALAAAGSILAGMVTASALSDRFQETLTALPAVILGLSFIALISTSYRQDYLNGVITTAITISVGIPIGWGTLVYRNELKSYLAGTGPIGLAMACSILSMLAAAVAVYLTWAVAETRRQHQHVMLIGFVTMGLSGLLTWVVAAPYGRGDGAIGRAFSSGVNPSLMTPPIVVGSAFLLIFASFHLGRQAISESQQNDLVRTLGLALITLNSTCFSRADLTEANFSQAELRNTNFHRAILTRTDWHLARNLHLARWGQSVLQNPLVRRLLVTRSGRNLNLDGLDLTGLNLDQVDLEGASLIGATLSYSSLCEANLNRAKLVRTQLEETDLRWARLTGACIQDWGLTASTHLDEVDCRYIYLRHPTDENPDPYRKPDNRQEEFGLGEFANFIAPLQKTLDLYHNQQVDPRAIAVAFQALVNHNPQAKLELLAMEKRGQNKLLLRVKTAPTADRSQLHQDYFQDYNRFRSLPAEELNILATNQGSSFLSIETLYRGLPSRLVDDPVLTSLTESSPMIAQNLGVLLSRIEGQIKAGSQLSRFQQTQALTALMAIVNMLHREQDTSQLNIKHPLRILQGVAMTLERSSPLVQDVGQLTQILAQHHLQPKSTS